MPWPIVPAPRTATVFTSTDVGTVAAFASAVLSGLFSSCGVVKQVYGPDASGGVRARSPLRSNSTTFAGEVILHAPRKRLPRERAAHTARSGHAGAPRASNPAYRQSPLRGLK